MTLTQPGAATRTLSRSFSPPDAGSTASVQHTVWSRIRDRAANTLGHRVAHSTAAAMDNLLEPVVSPAMPLTRRGLAGRLRLLKPTPATNLRETAIPTTSRRSLRTDCLALIASIFVSVSAFAGSAAAQMPAAPITARQDASSDDSDSAAKSGWHFNLTPYLWLSGLSGTITSHSPNAPAHDVTAGFGDILSHLNNVPLMGSFEARYDRVGLSADLMFISLRTPVSTPGPYFSGVTAQSAQLLTTELATYRVLELKEQWLDLGVGVRTIALWTKLTFNSGLAPGFTQRTSPSWANPLVAARYHVDLPDKFGLTAYGDVGGVNSNLTWQLAGTVDYRYSNSISFEAGYRHLHIDWSGSMLSVDLALSGPFLGMTYRF